MRSTIISLLILLLSGLPGCADDVTAVRLVITFSSIKPTQVSVTGKIGGQTRIKNERFPKPARALASGDDIVFRNFPDTDDGKVLNLTIKAFKNAIELKSAARVVKVVVRKGTEVSVTAHLGAQKKDGGVVDGPRKDGPGKEAGPKPDLKRDMKKDVKVPDQALPADKGCKVGSKTCTNGNIVSCVATDSGPAKVVQKCPLGCVPVQCKSMVPSNGLPTNFLGSGTIHWAPTAKLVTVNTSNGSISDGTTAPHVFVSQKLPAPKIMAISFASIKIPMGTMVEVTGPNALVVVASGNIEIKGIINGSGKASTPGPGGGNGGSYYANPSGPGAGGKGSEVKTGFGGGLYTLGGGAGGVHAGAAGGGGTGKLSNYKAPGGSPAAPYGKSELSPLYGGSGGGRGGTSSSKGAAYGGGGGGALMLVSGTEIIIGDGTSGVGGINAGGGGGGASTTTYRGGGGGGSGGAILLEAPKITLKKGSTLAVNGGGGGGGAGTNFGAKAGQPGDMVYAPTPGGAASAGGGSGGKGAGGVLKTGGLGGGAVAGGGGGGSAGIIRINTFTGAATISGSISGAMTQGKVTVTP